ncbi:hypothetical protein BC629DRAFT_1453598 [Irpex lacteus]|nr:hypothetical protein BC629DRAFT_1453598 [Irpex lacteus]
MSFTRLLTAVLSAALISGATALATGQGHVARSVDLAARAGCGSSGPLGTGHFEWFIDVGCTPGAQLRCQAMDASGCEPGKTNKIGSLEVDDPNDTFQVAKQSHTNSLSFVCPSGGQVRCQANFEDNDDGPGYSLRVVS